jgi:serine/threonine protein kinase/tetratricopeptide (TPR) repeat protein
MKCPKCDLKNPEKSHFCSKCGTKLSLKQPPKKASRKKTSKKKNYVSKTKTIRAKTTAEELTTGSTFAGRYQVIEELGKGGMGNIYKVLDTKIKEKIALKLINMETASDEKTIERFSNELKLARKVSHRNICRMYDLGEEQGTHYITMEFVAGEDLKNSITRMGPLTPGRAISLAKQLCKGLAEAHKSGVIHRDLKPQNVMIDSKGNGRILDFGIARTLKGEGLTAEGMIIGTPDYMAPEQVEGKELDQRTDIYSLGAILYEMLTGRVPFMGKSPISIAFKHKTEKPKDPRVYNDQIPEDFSRLVMKCMEKDRAKRFQNVDELYAELESVEENIPTTEQVLPKRKPTTTKQITLTFTWWKFIAPVLLLMVALVILLGPFGRKGLDVDPDRFMVAIFENKTGEESLDSYGRVAADWITQSLSQIEEGEAVPVSDTIESLRTLGVETGGTQKMARLRDLAKKTDSGTIISGSYTLTGGILQFDTYILDANRGKHIHTLESVSGPGESPMEVIETLRQRIMGTLAIYFSQIPSRVRRLLQPPLFEAYQEYLNGMDAFGQDYSQALTHFEHAVEKDPGFPAPCIRMAIIYDHKSEFAQAESMVNLANEKRERLNQFERYMLDAFMARLQGNYAKSLEFFRQAETLAPDDYVLNYLIGFESIRLNRPQDTVDTFKKIDIPEFVNSYEVGVWRFRVLAVAHHILGEYLKEFEEVSQGQNYFPDNISLRVGRVRALAALGRAQEIVETIEKSLTLVQQPEAPGEIMLEAAQELRAHGYLNESKEIANRAVSWYQSRVPEEAAGEKQRSDLAFALYVAEQWENAQKIFKELTEEYPGNMEYKAFMGRLAARMENRKEALKISDELAEIDQPYLFGIHTYSRACIASLLGEQEQAVVLLREAFTQGRPYGVYLHRDIDLEPLREYPPFQELLWPNR